MSYAKLQNLVLGLSLAALAACGGGGSTASQSGSAGGTVQASAVGTAVVSVTDAAGDFQHYIVNVSSLQLKRADGTAVETLPASTQVDFAKLVELSEIISAQQVPAGSYTSVSLTLDYSASSIVIDNGAGGSIAVPNANILNGSLPGKPAIGTTPFTLVLNLPAGQPLVVSNGASSHLALDFTLSLSNTLSPAAANISASTPPAAVTVTVNPTLAASLVPDATKSMNLRGGLVSVDTVASTYNLHVRPFAKRSGTHGDLTVKTSSATVFQINGTSTIGAAGLSALASVATETVVLANGNFDVATNVFKAETVYVGSSLPGAGLDAVEGTVTARVGNVLTLSNGVVYERSHDEGSFGKALSVTVGAGTKVTKAGQTGNFDAGDISIGQHVELSGTLATDGSGNRTLDSTSGAARLLVTPLWGLYVSRAANIVTVNLQSLDERKAAYFNFSGAGSPTANDAFAAAYTVDVPASLSTTGIASGAPVRFFGFVNSFGAAPPAFKAVSYANSASTTAKLEVEFNEPAYNNAPFAFSGGKLLVSQATLQGADEASIETGPVSTNLKSSAPVSGITLQSTSAVTTSGFVVGHKTSRRSDSYATFADFLAGLKVALPGGTSTVAVRNFEAEGAYDPASGTLTVKQLYVQLSD